MPISPERSGSGCTSLWQLLSSGCLVLLLAGCAAPIGAERVTTRQAYAQVEANALRNGKPSAPTGAILHRYDLDRLAARHPDEAVRQLHQKALATGDRDLLFALAELSYAAADQIRRSITPWDRRDARDFYLGSAVYAWLFLFGDGQEAPPGFLDPRLREAFDFYNYSLGLALRERKGTNAVVQLQSGMRRLPVGAIELQLNLANFPGRLEDFDQFLLADQFRVRGLSVRNRKPGVGAPLLAIRPLDPDLGARRCVPATVVLRMPRIACRSGGRHELLFPGTLLRFWRSQNCHRQDRGAPGDRPDHAYGVCVEPVVHLEPRHDAIPGARQTRPAAI